MQTLSGFVSRFHLVVSHTHFGMLHLGSRVETHTHVLVLRANRCSALTLREEGACQFFLAKVSPIPVSSQRLCAWSWMAERRDLSQREVAF